MLILNTTFICKQYFSSNYLLMPYTSRCLLTRPEKQQMRFYFIARQLLELYFLNEFHLSSTQRRTTALFVCMTLRPLFVVCTTAVHFNDFVWVCFFVSACVRVCVCALWSLAFSQTHVSWCVVGLLSLLYSIRWYFVAVVNAVNSRSSYTVVFFFLFFSTLSVQCMQSVFFVIHIYSYRLKQNVSQCAKAIVRGRFAKSYRSNKTKWIMPVDRNSIDCMT